MALRPKTGVLHSRRILPPVRLIYRHTEQLGYYGLYQASSVYP